MAMGQDKKYLMVNADDFGLLEGVNQGIIKAFRDGIVTGASIMPTGKAFDHAVALAKQNNNLDIGVHLSLTQDVPVSRVGQVTSLVDEAGFFCRDWRLFMGKFLRRRMRVSEVEAEWEAQIRKVLDAGLAPTHIDSHQHVHIVPALWTIACRLANKYNIRVVRRPYEISLITCVSLRHFMAAALGRALTNGAHVQKKIFQVRSPNYFLGMSASGRMNEDILCAYLHNLRPGITELMCHPGEVPEDNAYAHWGYLWGQELAALTNPVVRAVIAKRDIELINCRQMINHG